MKESDRLTGAAKKNRDQKRHGAPVRNQKSAPPAPAADGKKVKREFDRRPANGKG